MMNQLPVEQCRFCGGRDIRLACGIHSEIAAEPMYSFAKEEEERACRRAQVQDENNTTNEE